MKKKEPNKIINLQIHLQGTKQRYAFKVGQHTFIKEIQNLFAEQIGLDMLRAQIDFSHPYCHNPLNPTSTLYQNKITQKNEKIYAKIDQIFTQQLAQQKKDVGQKVSGKLTNLDLTYKMARKTAAVVDGLNIESICINPKCINYNRGIIHPLGMGQFDIFEILKGYQCKVCPYRDLHLIIKSLTREIKIKNCIYTVKGKVRQRYGLSSHELGCWVIVETEDSQFLNQILAQHDWEQAFIIVKQRFPSAKIDPLLL